MGLRSIGHYCFPCWVKSENEASTETTNKVVHDPQAASDCFRQGERNLFSLQEVDLEGEGTQNSLQLALEKFEASRNFGGTKGATVAGIFYECAISMSKPDYMKAYKYYEEAAEQGDSLAKCLIASFPQRVECGSIPGDYKHRKQLLKEAKNPAFVSASQDPLKWLKEAADKHRLGEAIYLLASCIEQGVGFRREDPVTAVGLYREAAKSGIKAARRALAKCYLNGNGVEKDVSAGKYWLIKAIKDNNDPEAMALLAMNYENGVFPPDENDYQEFTDLKHSELQKHVARTPTINLNETIKSANSVKNEDKDEDFEHVKWSSGPGTEIIQKADKSQVNRNERRDYRECHYWAQRSSDLGCAAGFYQLARCYEVGIGVAIDLEQCVGFYRSALDAGYAPAQFSLACFYCSGCVVEKRDPKKAQELLSQAAESGYTPAMISIATLYTLESKTHTRVVEAAPTNRFRNSLKTSLIKLRDLKTIALTIYDEELKKAMVWWRRAAKRGSRQAQYELALCFRDGRGVEVDLSKALYWMRQAAEAGLPEAQLELGVMLVQDLATVKVSGNTSSLEHDNESFYWILRAAKNGLPEAQIELAQLFVEGKYVHRNPSTAFYWFKRAAKAGHPYAQYRVGTMLLDGEVANGCVGTQGSQAEAVKWLKLASEQGWTDSDKLLPVALGMANEESVKTHRKEGKYIY